MSDLKKKIIDILFEPDETEVKVQVPFNTIQKTEPVIKKAPETKPLNAKEVLYGDKNVNNNSFIDYETKEEKEFRKEKEKERKELEEIYIRQGNVSPIFGLIDENEKETIQINNEVKANYDTGESSNNNEYINVILSPVYGYDSSKSVTSPDYFDFDDLDIDDEPFEMPKDNFNETIKEAVEEAVVELTPKNSTKNNDLYDTAEYKLNELLEKSNYTKKLIEEQREVIKKPNYQKSKVKTHSDIVNDYERILDTGEIPVTDYKTESQLAIEEEERQEIKSKNTELSDTSNEPISLFDLDSSDDDKDIFDELIGDDD